jgi:hypothetical protein
MGRFKPEEIVSVNGTCRLHRDSRRTRPLPERARPMFVSLSALTKSAVTSHFLIMLLPATQWLKWAISHLSPTFEPQSPWRIPPSGRLLSAIC